MLLLSPLCYGEMLSRQLEMVSIVSISWPVVVVVRSFSHRLCASRELAPPKKLSASTTRAHLSLASSATIR